MRSSRVRTVAIANQKGGVGKTTTAVSLAAALAERERRVLLIDLDPQGNASTGVGAGIGSRALGSYQVLSGEAGLQQAVIPTLLPFLDLLPATVDLAAAEVEFSAVSRREHRLKEILGTLHHGTGTRYDFVLIDCPPALGWLTVNALVAADSLLVPLQAEFLALEGLSHLLRTIDQVTRNLNPDLTIEGVLMTMVDRRNNLSSAVGDDVRAHLGNLVYKTEIPRNVKVSEAPSFGKPVTIYDPKCVGARAYFDLAAEFLERMPA